LRVSRLLLCRLFTFLRMTTPTQLQRPPSPTRMQPPSLTVLLLPRPSTHLGTHCRRLLVFSSQASPVSVTPLLPSASSTFSRSAGNCRLLSRFWVWTSCPKRTRSPFSAHVALSASWARTSSSQRSSLACQVLTFL